MNKTRTAVKLVVGTVVTAVLVLGSISAPAQAKDTGWNEVGFQAGTVSTMKDTGWNEV